MFTPEELESIPYPFEKHINELQSRILNDIVRRIKINEEITRSADWQIYKANQLGMLKSDVEGYIKEALKLTDNDIDNLYNNILEWGYARDEQLYKGSKNTIIPFKHNPELKALIKAITEQTKKELRNITGSLGFATNTVGKVTFKPIALYYQNILDKAEFDILSGSFDYNSTLKRTVAEMTDSGIRTVDYASGWTNRIPVATRRAVMTGFSQVTDKITEDNANALKTDLFEVTWHVGARPSHMIWQGRVFTKKQLQTVCGLGTGGGLCGWNCRHSYFPFIKGVSKRTYTDEQLKKMNNEELQRHTFGGKSYNSYEATQYQRKLETLMRKQREEINLLKTGNADEDTLIAKRCQYRKTSYTYNQFAKAMNLPVQRERIYIDGLGNIGVGKYKNILTNSNGKRILRVTKSSLTGTPNSITQKVNKKGGIDRNYYDKDGNQIKQISNNNHGNPKQHSFGKNGEHSHDYIYDKNGKLSKRTARELTIQEREENKDIL